MGVSEPLGASTSSTSAAASAAPSSASSSFVPSAAVSAVAPLVALGQHSFPKKQEGANFFLDYMVNHYPTKWQEVYGTPLLDSKKVMAWSPSKKTPPWAWVNICQKLTEYFWGVDTKLKASSIKKFGTDFWNRYKDEIQPTLGKDPKTILAKMHHYASLVPSCRQYSHVQCARCFQHGRCILNILIHTRSCSIRHHHR